MLHFGGKALKFIPPHSYDQLLYRTCDPSLQAHSQTSTQLQEIMANCILWTGMCPSPVWLSIYSGWGLHALQNNFPFIWPHLAEPVWGTILPLHRWQHQDPGRSELLSRECSGSGRNQNSEFQESNNQALLLRNSTSQGRWWKAELSWYHQWTERLRESRITL